MHNDEEKIFLIHTYIDVDMDGDGKVKATYLDSILKTCRIIDSVCSRIPETS